MLLNTIRSFKYLMDAYRVMDYKAAATSAMRDAQNGPQILETVAKSTGIRIVIISGDDEAAFIYENHIAENLNTDNSYLYVDVGGGSTELTCFADNKLLFKKSFNIGTIRLIKNQVTEAHWDQMKDFLKKEMRIHGKTYLQPLVRVEISIKFFPSQNEKTVNHFLWNY